MFENDEALIRMYAQSQYECVATAEAMIKPYHEKIAWIGGLGMQFSAIANFGCNIGYETLALVRFLKASEVIGLDIDEDDIYQARRDIAELRKSYEFLMNFFSKSGISEQTISLIQSWAAQPDPQFVIADATTDTSLQEAHFDLVYCNCFLYHIACAEISLPEEDRALSVLLEMVRILKPGGIIVAIEPTSCSLDDTSYLSLRNSFHKTGLRPLDSTAKFYSQENREVYCYQKMPV